MKKNKAFDHSHYEHWIDPNAVIPYEKNAKIHDDKQIANIVNSIKRFGWQQDTVLTKDNVCIIGHGRRLAAIKLGCEMPYHVFDKNADEVTDEDIRELRIADNQTNAETGFDFDVLADDIDGLDFEGFEFEFNTDENVDFNPDYTDEFELKDGDRPPVQNMTFTFSDAEAETIKTALSEMKRSQRFLDYKNSENANGNGNALFLVVDEWLQQKI